MPQLYLSYFTKLLHQRGYVTCLTDIMLQIYNLNKCLNQSYCCSFHYIINSVILNTLLCPSPTLYVRALI